MRAGSNSISDKESDLLQERKASWNKIAARKHHTYRVYVTDKACFDLLVIGRNDVECRNGERLSQEYAQNFLLQRQETGRLLIRKFQAFVVSMMRILLQSELTPTCRTLPVCTSH